MALRTGWDNALSVRVTTSLLGLATLHVACSSSNAIQSPSGPDAGPDAADDVGRPDSGGSSRGKSDAENTHDAARGTPDARSVTDSGLAEDAGTVGDGSQPDGGHPAFSLEDRPFLPSSSWNTPVDANATLAPLSWSLSGIVYSIGWSAYSAPIYVASPADPLVQISCPASWGWPANPSFHVPLGATGAPGTDGEIVVIDGTTVYNVWQFNRTGATAATGSAFASTDVKTGTGWGTTTPFLGAGIVAIGSSELAGMLVQAETDAGEIHHAIQIELPAPLNLPGFTGSAISGDGQSTSGTVQEGDRMAIPKSATLPSGLSTLGQKLFRALQTYGAYDVDTTDCCTVGIRAQQNGYDQTTIDALDADLVHVLPLLQKVE